MENLKPINQADGASLSPCLLKLLEKYYKSKRASRGSLIIINKVELVKSLIQQDILSSLNEDPQHAFGIMVKNGRKKHGNATAFGVTDKAKSYMMLMITLDDLKYAIIQWKSLPTWNPLAQTVVVVLEPMMSKYEKDKIVRTAFEMLFEVGMIYANVVYHMNKTRDIMETETWFPYDGELCADRVANIHKIDKCKATKHFDNETGAVEWEQSFETFYEEKYPKLPFTFHQCSFHASVFIWEPFVVAGEDGQIDSGLEILMLNTITKQMNLAIRYKILDNELATRKISYDNQTGIYADLIQK